MTFQIINPADLGQPKGWNNGMAAEPGGRLLFVAGQDATNESGDVTSTDFVDQAARAIEKVVSVVREAGGSPEHIGRLTFYVTDIDTYRANLKRLGVAYRSIMGRHFPAMSLVEVSALVDRDALVEIEATAVLPPPV